MRPIAVAVDPRWLQGVLDHEALHRSSTGPRPSAAGRAPCARRGRSRRPGPSRQVRRSPRKRAGSRRCGTADSLGPELVRGRGDQLAGGPEAVRAHQRPPRVDVVLGDRPLASVTSPRISERCSRKNGKRVFFAAARSVPPPSTVPAPRRSRAEGRVAGLPPQLPFCLRVAATQLLRTPRGGGAGNLGRARRALAVAAVRPAPGIDRQPLAERSGSSTTCRRRGRRARARRRSRRRVLDVEEGEHPGPLQKTGSAAARPPRPAGRRGRNRCRAVEPAVPEHEAVDLPRDEHRRSRSAAPASPRQRSQGRCRRSVPPRP